MYVNPSNLTKVDGRILINYDVVVKNIDTQSHQINLQKSRIEITKQSFPIKCSRYKEKDELFTLEAGVQTRIVCLAELAKNQFPRSDYQSVIEIPLDQDLARFEYLLRAEDFQ
jgi:hypothetical protein